jgi:NitT/TauT family transport system substrate-binding protein
MFTWQVGLAAGSFGLAIGLAPTSGIGQEMNIIVALPAETLTFSAAFIAEDAGFYKQEGLKVSHRFITGVGSPNAVLAGSADFTIGTGPVFLRAAAKGQRMLAIANLIDKPLVELVLRKDVAEAGGITATMPLAERAKRLKDKTIAIQGVGSIIHAWERYVVHRGGLDIEKDVRIAPMDPPGMLPALESKQIDGFATSLPYTTQAVLKGDAIMLASFATDAPELLPFGYGLIYTLPKTCADNKDKCARVVRALTAATRFIHDNPDQSLELLKKRFAKMDQAVLAEAWKTVAKSHGEDFHVTVPALIHSQEINLEAKLLQPTDTVKNFDGLYTDEFIK